MTRGALSNAATRGSRAGLRSRGRAAPSPPVAWGGALQVVELVLARLKPRFLGVKSRALHKHVRSVQLQQEGCAAEAAPAASS